MIKERIKSCLLCFLIVSSIVLTLNIWFSGKLWSDGYNFFSNITNYFESSSKNHSYYLSKENISYPQRIIVNNNEKRNLYTHTANQYNHIIHTILDIVKESVSTAEFVQVDPAEWNSSLKGKSVYLSYPVVYDASLLLGILDVTPASVNTSAIKDFVVSVSEKNDGSLNIYTKDYSNGNIFKANVNMLYAETAEIIEEYAKDSINLLPYSFELNFDKTEKNSVEQKIVVDPTVILSLEGSRLPVIENINQVEDIYNNNELSENLIKTFGYNTTNTRKYLDGNNSAVYVENYSSIKIHENGLFEYKALDNSKGIPLTTGTNSTQHDIFIACVEFVNNLWDNAFPQEELNVNLTSDIHSSGKDFYLTMDYYVNGYLATSYISENKLHSTLAHGIEITVSDGKIVEYRQLFNKFRTTDDYIENGSAINAIDRMFADNSLHNSTITELNIAYLNDGDKWLPTWSARTTEGKHITIRR